MNKTLRYSLEILKISWQANGYLAILSIVSAIYQNTLFPFFQILTLSMVLDLVQKQQTLTIQNLIPYATLYIIAAVINSVLASFTNLQQFYIDAKFETHLDRVIIKKLTELDPATFEKPAFQELLTQIESIRGTMSAQLDRLVGLINAVAKVITAIIVLFPIFPIFIPFVLISVFPSFYFGDEMRKKLWPFFSSKRSVVLRITEYVKKLLSQDSTSKEAAIFHTGRILHNKVSSEQKYFFREYKKIYDPFLQKIIGSNLLQLFVFLYTQYFNLTAVLRGALGVGQFTLAFQQTLNLATGSQAVLDMYSSMMMRMQLLDKFFEFMKYKPSIVSSQKVVPFPTTPTPPVIEFKNVSFRYPQTKRDILKHFNITIKSGEKIALVGENGAGKTTIIKLLLRFYDVSEGELLINGINIKDLSVEEWQSQVGALFQDFIKYQFTFKENVYFGNLDKKNDEELLKDAILKSGADKYLDSLPKGINQIVGKMFDDGLDLSGGQWQKLALARAFFRNAPILVLDEPTSAIDAKAEYEIFENVQKLQSDKTVLIISHRFSTVRNADRILVLEEGNIIEEGSHDALMKMDGLYAELFNIQAKGYK